MIYFLTTKRHDYTIKKCLRSDGEPLQSLVQPMCYGSLFMMRNLPAGTYVLSDLERLTESDLQRLVRVREQLDGDSRFRVLSHPRHTLGRLDLLHRMHAEGINSFTGYQLWNDPHPKQFPVFIRGEDDHKGPLSRLIESQPELERVASEWGSRWGGKQRKLVIEHCDVSDDKGVFRKYAAFKIGDRILPRHLFFGTHWCVKSWELLEPEMLEEERKYIVDNPHNEDLERIFDIAGVEFGRIDYGILDGKIQVWEINTNPMLPVNFGGGGDCRQELHDQFAKCFVSAVKMLDLKSENGAAKRIDRAVPMWSSPAIAYEAIYQRVTRGKRQRVA